MDQFRQLLNYLHDLLDMTSREICVGTRSNTREKTRPFEILLYAGDEGINALGRGFFFFN